MHITISITTLACNSTDSHDEQRTSEDILKYTEGVESNAEYTLVVGKCNKIKKVTTKGIGGRDNILQAGAYRKAFHCCTSIQNTAATK